MDSPAAKPVPKQTFSMNSSAPSSSTCLLLTCSSPPKNPDMHEITAIVNGIFQASPTPQCVESSQPQWDRSPATGGRRCGTCPHLTCNPSISPSANYKASLPTQKWTRAEQQGESSSHGFNLSTSASALLNKLNHPKLENKRVCKPTMMYKIINCLVNISLPAGTFQLITRSTRSQQTKLCVPCSRTNDHLNSVPSAISAAASVPTFKNNLRDSVEAETRTHNKLWVLIQFISPELVLMRTFNKMT